MRHLSWGCLSLVAALALWPRAAAGQSTRYPAPPADEDSERDARSELWEQAVEPGRAPQARLLGEAKRLIAGRTPGDLGAAVRKISEAIELRPDEPAAYFLRALAYEQLQRWPECAADLGKTLELDPRFGGERELRYADNPALGLGVCLARAGRLAEAEIALDRAVARTPGTQEWLRLGETRIAMGKLREGLEALAASAQAGSETVLTIWLGALAHDRARQSSQAAEAIGRAAVLDRSLRQLTNPAMPFVSKAEELYLLGLGFGGIGRPELALAYFRAAAELPEGQLWARRVREHIEALEQTDFPLEVGRSGPAPLDPEVARAAVKKALPKLVECVKELPRVAFTVRVTRSKVGPAAEGAIRTAPPAPGVVVTQDVAFGEPSEQALARAERCIQAASAALELPPIKAVNTWHYVTFSFIAHNTTAPRRR